MSTIIKYRKRVPSVLVPVLNRREFNISFKSQHELDVFNTALNEAMVICNSTLPKELKASTVLNSGLKQYYIPIKYTQPKAVYLTDITTLYLAYSKGNVTTVEYKKRVAFLTKVPPTYFKACNISLKVDEVTSKDLYALSQYMGKQANPRNPSQIRKPQTVNRYIKLIRGMVNYGHSVGLYSLPNTMPTLKLTNSSEVRRIPLNDTEYTALYKNLYGDSLLLLNVLYLSGLRPSELYKCVIDNVDGVVCFNLMEPLEPLKTKASYRIVPVHSKLLPNIDTIKTFTKQDILRLSRVINNTIKEVLPNSEGKSLYSARHSVVTNLINKGVGIEKVQAIIGHASNASMTIGVYHAGFKLSDIKESIELL